MNTPHALAALVFCLIVGIVGYHAATSIILHRNRAAQPLRQPAPLPCLHHDDTQAAWTTGWWQGKVVGIGLGLAIAVLIGWLK